ncbi:DUF2283 domain-containing protein [Amycolatopsis rhabdoformis]|uniref:DUF2283 domain-containing protein n=1 Tax=Amycolatopsis rhabdoformis TaxID=1448059 RepID=A0ABZ1HXN4_9PSEU|nr:DUF2283 domain-containing protein [Amycolatopsis rhabdoformis]WSE26276.1 DUF2283 domain-containing protein [Amycolatopsis rhabdoformis]
MGNLKVTYDAAADAAYVYFTDPAVEPRSVYMYPCDPVEVSGMINFDFLADGRVLGIEVLAARSKLPAYVLDGAERIDRPARLSNRGPVRAGGSRMARARRTTKETFNGTEIELTEDDTITATERTLNFVDPTWREDAVILVVSLPRGCAFTEATVAVHPHRGSVPAAFLAWALGVAERRMVAWEHSS